MESLKASAKHDDKDEGFDTYLYILHLFNWKGTDDFCNKLSRKYTVAILMAFAGVVALLQFLYAPIVCWCPAHFTEAHVKYANSYCWVKNTYYSEYESHVPRADESRDYIRYYQWTAFILVVQAVLFYLPSTVWHTFNSKGPIDTDNVLELATRGGGFGQGRRIANLIHQLVENRKRPSNKKYNICRRLIYFIYYVCDEKVPGFIILLFFFTKLLFLTNALGQYFLLDYFLFNQFSSYGFEIMGGVVPDHDWQDAPFDAFPRVTMCDMNVRRLGNVQRYTLQCTLPLNRINEKIFMFLWFWLALVMAVTMVGFLQWLLTLCIPGGNQKFVAGLLSRKSDSGQVVKNDDELTTFVKEYLKADGVFILRLIVNHANPYITSEVAESLWELFEKNTKKSSLNGSSLLH